MNAGELCNRNAVVADASSTIPQIAQLMREFHVGSVIITKDSSGLRKPIGIITDRDIVIEMIAKDLPVDSCNAGDMMSYQLVTARENEDVWEVMEEMRSKGIRRIPIVDHRDALVGILAADDLIEYVRDQLDELAGLLGREQNKEKQQRR